MEAKQRLMLSQTVRAAYESTLRYGKRMIIRVVENLKMYRDVFCLHHNIAACHELRNPLHAICATLEFVREDGGVIDPEV